MMQPMELSLGILLSACVMVGTLCVAGAAPDKPDVPYEKGKLLFSDDFDQGTESWSPELEKGGTFEAKEGRLVIDVPGGCTAWFRHKLDGPVMIEYEATVIDRSGPNDRVSDLNCFWMAIDPRSPDDVLQSSKLRSGKFGDYDLLRTYYVGQGGHNNTKTRFRRYVGDGTKPLLPEHDLTDARHLIKPNTKATIQQVAFGNLIQYLRDGEVVFELNDPKPYTSGWFAFRTVRNHMEVDDFRVYRLRAAATAE